MGNKSVGTLEGIKKKLENKNTDIQEPKNLDTKEPKNKRSYNLKNTTIKKLEEMKLYNYDVGIELSDIVDEAICKLYESKKQP